MDVAQDAIIYEPDCGTLDGIEMASLEEGGEIIEHVADRILGRVVLEDIEHPFTGEIIVRANEEINEEHRERIQDAGIDRVKIRSVLSVPVPSGSLRPMLRPRPCPRQDGQHRRSCGYHCSSINW